MILNILQMVEAAGVEPASEIAVSQECSCFARFLLVSPPVSIGRKQMRRFGSTR